MKETLLLQKFSNLIEVHTGLQIRSQDLPSLYQKILVRMKALKLTYLEEYYALLSLEKASNSINNKTSEVSVNQSKKPTLFRWWNNDQETKNEWKELTVLLTTSESYFFRDKGQFHLLAHEILPTLINRQQNQRSLRIWSAGCSTGEEPYSIAILLQELIPNWQDWNLFILGTDLNKKNIEKAKQGLYSAWSFRLVNPEIQKQYFSHQKTEWEINPHIRKMVTFRYGNLIEDDFPCQLDDLCNMDLIICRNVFVYFSSAATYQVTQKFYHTLKPAGYLITAHAELHGQSLENFQAKVFSESIIYQRPETFTKENSPTNFGFKDQKLPPSTQTIPIQSDSSLVTRQPQDQMSMVSSPWVELLSDPQNVSFSEQRTNQLRSKFSSSKQNASLKKPVNNQLMKPPKVSSQTAQDSTSSLLLNEAKVLYQQEDYLTAIQKAQQVIVKDSNEFVAHYLIAQAYANLGNYSQAKTYCQKVIQVHPLTIEPWYLLAHIAEEEGNVEEAKELYKRIIYLSPKEIMAYLDLASLYQKAGDLHRAKKLRKTAIILLREIPPDTLLCPNKKVKAGEILSYLTKMLDSLS